MAMEKDFKTLTTYAHTYEFAMKKETDFVKTREPATGHGLKEGNDPVPRMEHYVPNSHKWFAIGEGLQKIMDENP